jgi:hypothetical protein
MSAIITNNFRLNAAKELVDDVVNNSSYYLFVGRSEQWDSETSPDVPYDNTFAFHTDAWQRMTALKEVTDTDITFAVPRYQWISGTTYSEYDDRDTTLNSNPFYVISDNNNVYICLKAGGISTQNPDTTGIQTNGIIDFTGSDGYIWKYLFTVSTDDTNKFLTSAFVPVRYLDVQPAVGADAALTNQWDVQQNAVDGAVYNIKITNGGSGYTSAPTVTITGDGSGLTATAEITSGVVTNIAVTGNGSGYNQCAVTISGGGGSGAAAYAVISPKGGFGADPRFDLRAHFVTLNVRLVYDDGQGDFIVGNDFRQIGVIRNPYDFGTTDISTAETLSATKSLTVAIGGTFANDSTIEGTISGAKAIVDSYDSVNGIIRIHQTEETGYEDFDLGDYIRTEGDAGSGQDLTAINNPEVQPYSGEVIFLENRTPVNRASDQIETIKLVLEF